MLKWLSNEIVYSFKTLKTIFINSTTSNLKKNIFKNLDKNYKEDTNLQSNIEKLIHKNLNIKLSDEISLSDSCKENFPVVLDIPFFKFFTKFINSPRDKDNPSININNVLFVTGPERSGKSTFIRNSLNDFVKRDTEFKNFAIHFDCRKIHNFDIFLFEFEEELINNICNRVLYAKKENLILLDNDEILKLLFYRYEKGWIEICLYKELLLIKEKNSIFQFNNENFLNNLISKYHSKKFKELPLLDNIKSILQNISYDLINSKNSNDSLIEDDSEIKKLLYLIKRILIKRESYNKECVEYRTGLNVMEYLLDVINFISGYHESQLLIDEIGFNPVELENENFQSNFENNENGKNENSEIKPKKRKIFNHRLHRIQSVLVIESIDNIDNFVDCEDRGKNWLRHLILRLYVRIYYL